MDTSVVQRRIEEALPGSKVEVLDQGGGDHLQVTVVSAAFAGKSRMQQHQMIYGLFREEMQTEAIHALALKTFTPEEA
ncbi:MAG: stress-induced morphogen [Candidatus Lindowbacteria bacterium RIFCSPLOWO2_12_FULL_62_27]|nr:MAG: stress-induced morphogen [Candidatus Lindowbacteria bacterium RIFCSPLOWO2_02_FULL_62_12]OGH63092.1 MAG: stress-induced morphogen [Candidatus Lindowbacteria bacterium RIFCSPLOWO2_12_FULL_62_27]